MNDIAIETPEQRRARIRAAMGVRPAELETVAEPTLVEQTEPVIESAEHEEPSWFERESLRDLSERAVLEAGIDYYDPELQELAGRRWGHPDDYHKAVGRLAARRKAKAAKQAVVTAGAVISESAVVPSVGNADDVARELSEIQSGAKGSPTSPANRERRAKLRADLREALTRG